MSELRKELHDQIERTRSNEMERLIGFIERFLHPLTSAPSERMVFEPVPPGSKRAAAVERDRQQKLAEVRVAESEKIRNAIGHALTRLGTDLDNIREGSASWSSTGGKSEEFTRGWFEGPVFNRLSMFHFKERKVVTFERCYLAEDRPELIYKIRVLTPTAEAEEDLTCPI